MTDQTFERASEAFYRAYEALADSVLDESTEVLAELAEGGAFPEPWDAVRTTAARELRRRIGEGGREPLDET